MGYLCEVQFVRLSSHSACFTFGTGGLIAMTFSVESLLEALCCRVSDAAVGEVHLLFELYEHFQQRLVVKKKKRNFT